MNIAERIQHLRKLKGLSQEELANAIGVSRQAVSKWESAQSTPDIEKIISLSDLFEVSTDYLLKGIEPTSNTNNKELISKILYPLSTAHIFSGLLCAFGLWHAYQTMMAIFGSMIIQAIGILAYYIAKIVSKEKPSYYIKWLNILGLTFMPLSMITGFLCPIIFKIGGWIAPYPVDIIHFCLFIIPYSIIAIYTHKTLCA